MSCSNAERRQAARRNEKSLGGMVLALGRTGLQGGRHRGRQPVPTVHFLAEAPLSGGGERVELRAAVVVRRAPLGVEEPLVFEPVERRIEGSLFDQERAAGD